MAGFGSSPSKSPELKLSPTTYQTIPSRLLLLLLATGDSLELLSAELLNLTSSLELLDSAELLDTTNSQELLNSAELLNLTDSLKLLDAIGSPELLDAANSPELLDSAELQDISTEDERPQPNASLLEEASCELPATLLKDKNSAEEELSPHDTQQKEPINNAAIALSLIKLIFSPC